MNCKSIDLSGENIWRCWFAFRHGKRPSKELESFTYYLEAKLSELYNDLQKGTYRHGGYHIFTVVDNKRRTIFVSSVRDRVVHRLLYEYLTNIYDHTFIFDVWSCRKGKGLIGAIDRTQTFLHSTPESFVWRADITKFFDHVNHEILMKILRRSIIDPKALWLLEEVVSSYSTSSGAMRERERERVKCAAAASRSGTSQVKFLPIFT